MTIHDIGQKDLRMNNFSYECFGLLSTNRKYAHWLKEKVTVKI